MSETSKWKIWSLGTVVEDKPFGIDVIRVSPIERLPLQSGNPAFTQNEYNEKLPNAAGSAGQQVVKSTKVIEAEWTPDGDNHLFTSPMVRKGEVVKVYKFGDTNKYYWNTIYRSPDLRRTERIIWGAGNLSSPGGRLDLDSIYYLEFDTLNKVINIKTSLSDGEEFMYQLSLNPGTRQAFIVDNVGNKFIIDSPSNNVILEDVSGGRFETRDGHPKITGTKGFLLTSPNNVIEGNTEFKDNVIVRKTLTSVGVLTMNSGMNMSQGNGGSGGGATFNGPLTLNNPLTVNSSSVFTGYANFQGGHGPH